jgi:hypothetical protein
MKFDRRSVTLNTKPEDSMKPIAICSYLAFAALSLYAADPQAANNTAPSLTVKHAQTQFSPQATVLGDSPLVRAAKSTNRFGKRSSQVITNETLVREGGHFTTTTAEAQSQLPAHNDSQTTYDQMAAEVRRARAEQAMAAEQKRKVDERRAVGMQPYVGETPEGLYENPPALENGNMQVAKPVSPQVVNPRPPQ